jgi:hypothetical protein
VPYAKTLALRRHPVLEREPVSFSLRLANYGAQLLLSSKPIANPGASVVRLIIAVVVGVVIALGGTVLVTNVLSTQANGTPTPASSSLYNYGTR